MAKRRRLFSQKKIDKYLKELDDIPTERMDMLKQLYASMSRKGKLKEFQKFFKLTDEEYKIIEEMFSSRRAVNSGKKKTRDGYGGGTVV